MRWVGLSSLLLFVLFLVLPLERDFREPGWVLLWELVWDRPAYSSFEVEGFIFVVATAGYVAALVSFEIGVYLRKRGVVMAAAAAAAGTAIGAILLTVWIAIAWPPVSDMHVGYWCWVGAPVVLAVGAWGVWHQQRRETVRGFEVVPVQSVDTIDGR